MNAEDIYYDLSPEVAHEKLAALAQKGDQAAEFYLGHLAEEQYPADFVEALVCTGKPPQEAISKQPIGLPASCITAWELSETFRAPLGCVLLPSF